MSWRRANQPAAWTLRALLAICVLIGALVLPALADGAEELPTAAHWKLEAQAAPTNLPLKGEALITATATNVGDANVVGEGEGKVVTLTDRLPAGFDVIAVEALEAIPLRPSSSLHYTCSALPVNPVRCTLAEALAPYEHIQLRIRVRTNYGGVPSAAETENEFSVEGGGVPKPGPLVSQLKVNGQPTVFGVENYELTPENEDFTPDTQAGSHPFQMTTTLNLNQGFEPEHTISNTLNPSAPGALLKNVNIKLPPGLLGNANVVGNPNAVQQCAEVSFGAAEEKEFNACPADTAIGVATVTVNDPIDLFYTTRTVPVFNLRPAPGEPARFGFEIRHDPVILDTSVRTGGDYGATVSVHYSSEAVQVLGSTVTFWGNPGDPRHDGVRGWACLDHRGLPDLSCAPQKAANPSPFLVLPTACGSLKSTVETEAWNAGTLAAESKPNSFAGVFESPLQDAITGCEGLSFDPSFAAVPGTNAASTPTGLDVRVGMPTEGLLEADGKADADLSSTTLELPQGLTASASASTGLETCSTGALGFEGAGGKSLDALEHEAPSGDQLTALGTQGFTPAPANCPNASKVGTVDIKTPLLENDVVGSLYLGGQDTNPFASPLVMYIVAEEETSKVLVKLAGEVKIDPQSGRLVSVFRDTPQTPFESLKVHLYNTERATQATPAFCGEYQSHATFASSFSNKEATRESGFQIISGPGGTPCPGATLPFTPSFEAGSTNSQAGAFSPFTLKIQHPDGNAALKTIAMRLPPGAAALIGSVTPCPETQASQGTCGPESEIGDSVVRAGLGGSPYSLPGKVYLTGPYGGAPFGLSSVTSLKAGPFNLGTAVARSTITVDPNTAAATIDTEATSVIAPDGTVENFAGFPEKLKGVPSQIKELDVTVNRPNFEFNPTTCDEQKITGDLTGYEGGSSPISQPYFASNCGGLPSTPKLTATVQGHASKANGTTFAVTVESPGLGQANIHKVNLTLPAELPSRLTTIQKACLEAVFDANPAGCEEGSVIGEGIVHTPVFKNPLRGPAYLVSHGGAAFPDVEFVLQGENITLVLDGKTDIKKGITYSRFETTPDAPFTKFESIFPAGPHSALTANVPESENFNLCKHTLTVPTELTAHNGAFIGQTTKVQLLGCGGVAAFTTGKAKIKKHHVNGSTLTLVVAVPSSGRIVVKGSGLKTFKKAVKKGGSYTLKVKLGPKGKAAVTHNHHLSVHVHLSFAPTHGKTSSAAVTAKFH